MKTKSGFMLREVAGSYVVVAVGGRSEEFNGMVNLNASGALLWKTLEKGADRDGLIRVLLDHYDVSEDQAAQDVDKFIGIVTENAFVEN